MLVTSLEPSFLFQEVEVVEVPTLKTLMLMVVVEPVPNTLNKTLILSFY